MLPAPFQQEGAILPVLIPPHFERFYRAALRRVVGSRVRSVKLRDAYLGWAGDHSAPSMSFIELRQSLEALGHRRVQSDGVHYADIILASDAPELADMLPAMPGGFIGSPRVAEKDEVIAKVDAVLASLLDLRRTLVAKVEREAPAEAAQRILDLFER